MNFRGGVSNSTKKPVGNCNYITFIYLNEIGTLMFLIFPNPCIGWSFSNYVFLLCPPSLFYNIIPRCLNIFGQPYSWESSLLLLLWTQVIYPIFSNHFCLWHIGFSYIEFVSWNLNLKNLLESINSLINSESEDYFECSMKIVILSVNENSYIFSFSTLVLLTYVFYILNII